MFDLIFPGSSWCVWTERRVWRSRTSGRHHTLPTILSYLCQIYL